jgi:putative heme-binding domain-containing protein
MHDNDWYVRTGRRLLQERGLSRDDVAYLTGELLTHADVTKRLRAMWALHVGGAFTPELAAQLPPDDHLTAWAIRLLLERGGGGLERLAGLALDAGPVTRRALASGLQRMPLEKRWAPAARLVRLADVADDVNIPLLVWYGVEPLVALDPRRALRELARPCALERVRAFIHRRAAGDEEGRLALFEELAATHDTAYVRGALQDVITALGDRRGLALPASWPQLYARLAQSADADVRERALIIAATFGDPQAFPALRARLADALAPRAERERALDALERARDAEAVPIIVALLDDDALRGPALRALAGFADPRAAPGILERWSRFDAEQRTDAVATLTSRVDSALPLLRAMQDGAVEPALLTAFDVRKLRTHGDERVNALVTAVWGNVRDVAEDAAAQIASWKERLTDERLARADLAQGRAVFARTCQRCHSLYGVGEAIGPDITGSNRADLDYLLTNMVDPSAEVPKEYRMTVVATTDGRVVNGILQRETADAIVLRTENDVVTLATDEVDARKLDENSMMPAGQLDTLSEDEVAALVAYLRHDAQVPQRMTADDLAAFFDGATLARWSGDAELWSVEDGVLVGRSPGLDRNAFLVSDWDLGDFRLVLDVKLTPAAGNSGVQFRSRATEDGDVAGYQADIGGGWWGTLYDEHGRGALVSGPRDDLVREWNTYEVLAVGDRIQTALNGTRCVDFTDSEPRARGVVALQLHSGSAFEVRFRDLRLELDPEPWLSSVR